MAARKFNAEYGFSVGNADALITVIDASANANFVAVTANGNISFTGSNVSLGSVSNLKITGGTSGYVLRTDGAGNLSWVAQTGGGGGGASISNGTSNINIPTVSDNIYVSVAGNANVVTFTGNAIYRNVYDISGFVYQANTAPSNPQPGDQWYNTYNGILFEYINDGTNSQWVDIGSLPYPNIVIANASAVQTNTSVSTTAYPTFVTSTTNANYSLNVVSGISANLANNSITATTFLGTLANGNSNVNIPAANGNINLTSVGNVTLIVTGTGINVAGTLNTGTGNANVGNLGVAFVGATANVTAPVFVSNVATGTAPLTVTSNTKVTNLNADLLDGYNTDTANTASTVAVRDANGNVAANFFIGNGSQLTGIITSVSNVSNGTSNLNIPAVNGNVNISAAGNANILVVTGTGVNVSGTFSTGTGNANVGNLGVAFVGATANVTAPVLVSNIATGTAPLTVSSTTKVTNLNADLLDGYNTDTANTASTVAVRDANGNVSANFFIGNGSQLTGIITSVSNISNGTSNVNIPAVNGNVNVSAAGNANILVVTGTGVNVSGTLNTGTGNANVGNIGGTTAVFTTGNITTVNGNIANASTVIANAANGTIFANNITASGAATGNANASTLTGNLGLRAIATTYTDNSAAASATLANAAIHGIGTPTLAAANATVTATNAATFFIQGAPTAGTNMTITNPYSLFVAAGNSYLAGNVTFAGNISGTLANGTSNVSIPVANSNVNISAAGISNVFVVTGTGANISGTANVTGNANVVGNLTVGSGSGGNISGANVVTANTFIGNTQLSLPYRTVTSNTSISTTDGLVVANGTLTITLPSASTVAGRQFYIKNINNSGGVITVLPSGTDLIDGYSNVTISYYNTMFGVISISTGWVIF